MRHTEILLDKDQQRKHGNRITKPVAIIGGVVLVLNALYLGSWGIGVLGEIFSLSTPVGLIMLVTAVGFLPFGPLWLGIASLSWFGSIPTHVSKMEYQARIGLCFIAGLVGPYLLYFPAILATFTMAALVSSLVE